jgi:hypothetical protein
MDVIPSEAKDLGASLINEATPTMGNVRVDAIDPVALHNSSRAN